MKIIIPLLLALLTLSACAAPGESSAAPAEFRMIGMEEAVEMMEREDGYLIVDVRTPEEFAQAHIPGAINVPNEDIGTEPPALLPDKEQLIMVYCRSGNRSKQASQKLADMGYSNIVEFGGIKDWPGETVSGGAGE